MSKIETTSKVSLNFPSRINHGRRGAQAPTSQLWTRPISPPTAPKGRKPEKLSLFTLPKLKSHLKLNLKIRNINFIRAMPDKFGISIALSRKTQFSHFMLFAETKWNPQFSYNIPWCPQSKALPQTTNYCLDNQNNDEPAYPDQHCAHTSYPHWLLNCNIYQSSLSDEIVSYE